jgi:ribonuclease P protein component
MDRAAGNEADIQAPQPQAGQQARIPRADEDQGRSQDAQSPEAAWSGSHRGDDRREVADAAAGRPERLPRGARIQGSADIRRLLADGKRRTTPCLDVFVADSPAPRSRLGLIVPKLGRRIVDRNLLKRRLREIGRRQLLANLDASGRRLDVLIRARGRAYAADFETLAREAGAAMEGLWPPGS